MQIRMMKSSMSFGLRVFVLAFGATVGAAAQTQTPGSTTPSDSSGSATTFDRPVSEKLLLHNIFSDQLSIWRFPTKIGRDHNWVPVAAFVAITASLVALDSVDASWFRRTSDLKGFNGVFSSNATSIGIVLAPASLYFAGLARKDTKMRRTGLLAGEALADSEILSTVLKYGTSRRRPSAVPPHGNFSDTWLEGQGGSGGFPSGHTIAAFSVATIIARRYGNHRWVPYAAYGAAALVGFSRVSLSAHFISDVFVGGALGYSISRFSVLRQ